jgi:hypothetical protein
MKGWLVITLATSVLTAIPLSAHHGSAAFDPGKSVTLKGSVTQWVYTNPHLLLTFDVKGEDGTTVQWVAETQAPNIMYPAGYRRDTFKVGDEVTVTVQPVKNGRPIGRILKVITAAGWTLGGIQDPPIPPQGK